MDMSTCEPLQIVKEPYLYNPPPERFYNIFALSLAFFQLPHSRMIWIDER